MARPSGNARLGSRRRPRPGVHSVSDGSRPLLSRPGREPFGDAQAALRVERSGARLPERFWDRNSARAECPQLLQTPHERCAGNRLEATQRPTSIMKAILPLFVFIDACGWEIIKDSPFASALAPERKRLASVFGYSSACVPSIVSGSWPVEHRN